MKIEKNGFTEFSDIRVAIVGNYSPRRCGIATFTEDLTESLIAAGSEVTVIAMDDRPEGYDYPNVVKHRILQSDIKDYIAAAEQINRYGSQVLSLQHEFGIFGGPAGSHILELLKRIDIPVVTTLHTVLQHPGGDQMRVMQGLIGLSDRFVVMSQKGRKLLVDIYGITPDRVDVIHHGVHAIPNSPRISTGVRQVLSFGLLGPDKGIEHVIRALPSVVCNHNVEYKIVGATHPNLVAQHGEEYRNSLISLADSLGVAEHVRFVDKFVTREELQAHLSEAELCITAYNKEQQITSGVLANVVGNGKVAISTPYWYARELLADGRGVLVPHRDPQAIAKEMNRLLCHEDERLQIAARALAFGKQMRWPNVATAYQRVFAQCLESDRTGVFVMQAVNAVPPIRFDHLNAMTDDTGLFQHAFYAIPNRNEGYCVDDNARALQLVCIAHKLGAMETNAASALARKYLAFLAHAFNPQTRSFRNFMSFDRRWLDEHGSEDCQGRALQALAAASRYGPDPSTRRPAAQLFGQALSQADAITSPRAVAFALLGILDQEAVQEDLVLDLSARLTKALDRHCDRDWPWFEDSLTYCNAVLPHALLAAAGFLRESAMKEAALKSLRWLALAQMDDEGKFTPIGTNGFHLRGGRRAHFDQQPVEAATSLSAYRTAYDITGAEFWLDQAQRAFGWFIGQNHLGVPIFDAETGGCMDGVHHDRVNENQGAESTLSFLMSQCEWSQLTKCQHRELRPTVHAM